jgi:acetate kinase
MAVTLVVNPGSSSKKYALFVGEEQVFAVAVEHDPEGVSVCTSENSRVDRCERVPTPVFATSLLDCIERALHAGVLKSATDITLVGVRVVAPGTYFTKDRLVDDAFMRELAAVETTAPLHIPHLLKELSMVRQALPHAPIVAASDSAFHATLPAHARNYSITPAEAKRLDLYRFGYHGLSVASVLKKLPTVSKSASPHGGRVIVCHIGSGVSVTTVKDGKSVDTTMGYAPGSGLVMGSRSGDLDAGALLRIIQRRNLTVADALLSIGTEGGLRGFCGESDLRQVLQQSAQGVPAANIALRAFVVGIQKAIGAGAAVLGGVDTLVFTGTAALRSPELRAKILAPFSYLQVVYDEDKNHLLIDKSGNLSTAASTVEVLVIKTEEAAAIFAVANSFILPVTSSAQ